MSGGNNSLENRSPTRRNAKLSPRVDSHAACLWAQVCHARTPYPGYARLTRERTETITPSRPAACGWLSGTGDHGGNCEARLFFAFVGPVFRLVNEHAVGLALIGSGRADRTGDWCRYDECRKSGPHSALTRNAHRCLRRIDRRASATMPATLQHSWTRLVATVVLNPMGQLPITIWKFRRGDCGANRRCSTVVRSQTRGLLPRRARDRGRGDAATQLSLHVYHNVAANRAAPCMSANVLSFGLDRSPQKQQADTDEYDRRNAMTPHEAGLG